MYSMYIDNIEPYPTKPATNRFDSRSDPDMICYFDVRDPKSIRGSQELSFAQFLIYIYIYVYIL